MGKLYKYITIDQPIGRFYVVSINAVDLLSMVGIERRSEYENGAQRELDRKRVSDITNYCSDPDATFPTSIIVNVTDASCVKLNEEKSEMEIDTDVQIGTVIDGQHRLAGISKSSFAEKYQVPVVLMFELTPEEQAYVFSIINGKQAPMNKSLIIDLFALSTVRSPQRTAHEIARALNKEEKSPFCNKLKMLGYKAPEQEIAMISQGTFANELIKIILKRNEYGLRPHQLQNLDRVKGWPIRDMYIDNQDKIIYQIILNCFNALKEVFPEYWEKPKTNILWKTSGFGGIMKSLPDLVMYGINQKSINVTFFRMCFNNFKKYLESKNIQLTSGNYPGGGEQLQKNIARDILIANGLIKQ